MNLYPYNWSRDTVYEFVDSNQDEIDKCAWLCGRSRATIIDSLINILRHKQHARFAFLKRTIKNLDLDWKTIKKMTKEERLAYVKYIKWTEHDKFLDSGKSTIDISIF